MKKKNLFIFLLISSLLSGCDNNFNDTNSTSSDSISDSVSESNSSDSSSASDSSSTADSSGSLTSLEDMWSNDDFGNYYASIDLSLLDTALLSSLQELNKKERKTTVGYKGMWTYYPKTDYNPKNPSEYIAFYRGTSAKKSSMNKEHVWPKSRGGNKVDDDIHMVRPTLSKDNTGRGNSFYVEGLKTEHDGWDPVVAGLEEKYRGIAARIIFYCVVADKSLKLVDTNTINSGAPGYTYSMGKLSDLLAWNLKYPVDETEFIRNEGAQDVQGNRNPFIDNPGFACAIWGGYNSKTKSICGRK